MQRILVAVDGSEASSVSARYAIALCQATGAHLDALSIVDKDAATPLQSEERLESLAERHGENLLQHIAKWAEEAGVSCQSILEYGDTKEQLLFHSDSHDLTVLGATGSSSRAAGLGGTASWIAENAIRPVLVTRGEYRPLQKVYIGYNRSSASASALRCITEIAAKSGSEVTVVVGANSHAEGEVLLKQAQTYLESYGISSEAHLVIPEDGANALFHASNEAPPDLIVVGSRGANALSRLLLGSTSQTILEQAECPVLILH